MSRLGYLTRHPKRSLSALSTLLVAAGLTVGSTAYFQDTEESASNSVGTGGINIGLYGSAAEVVDARNCTAGPGAPAGSMSECEVLGTDAQITDGEAGTPNPPATTFKISNLSPTNVVPVGQEPDGPNSTDQAGVIERRFKVTNPDIANTTADLPVHVWFKLDNDGDQGLLDQANIRIHRVDSGAGGDKLLWDTNGNKTFAQLDGDQFAADQDTAGRDRLNPGDTFEYAVQIWLPENGQSQNALMNKSITNKIEVIARSVDSVDPTP